MLQLGHVLFGGGFLRERPGQHEFGLEHRARTLHNAVQRRRHPPLHRVENLPLHLCDDLAGIALVPVPIEMLGYNAERGYSSCQSITQLAGEGHLSQPQTSSECET